MNFTTPTSFTGLGATLQNGGCVYRIWAPFAEQVMLRGDFFHPGAKVMLTVDDIQMARDKTPAYGNDYWSVFVEGAVADSLYKFQITNSTGRPDMHMPPNGGWKLDPYSRDATRLDALGNSVVVDRDFDWTGDNFQMPGWNQMVIYELHIGSFNRPADGSIGTFADVIPKLGYLAALGINAIQVMPAPDFDTTTSMGYNTVLPFALDNAYGTVKTFKAFIKAAHEAGIAVILDVVYNHFGERDGPGMDECLSRLDGWWVNDTRGIYFFSDGRLQTPWFDSRPDYGRGEIRQYIRDNAMTFLSEFHLDGLRLDSVINIRTSFSGDLPEGWTLLRWLGEEKRSSQAWKILIAEDLQNDSSITKDALFGGMGLDSQWDSWFKGRLRDMMFAPNDDARSTQSVVEAIGKSYNDAGLFQRVVYIESHDEAHQNRRLPDMIAWGNANGWYPRKLSTLAAALTFTSPGIPMFFMGQEFLEYRPWDDKQDYTSLDWSRTTSCGGIVEVYRRLIQLRRNWDNNTRGLHGSNINIFHADPGNGVIAFHRWDQSGGGDDVIVVANIKGGTFNSYNIGFPQPGNWFLRFNSDWGGYWSDYGNVGYDTTSTWGQNQNMPCNGNIGIGPYSLQIFSQ